MAFRERQQQHHYSSLIGNDSEFKQKQGIFTNKQIDPNLERKVYDMVHGFIRFPQKIWEFIDTPQFQRLRKIKQLGTLSYVFPTGSHSKFQHSIGTGYMAQKYIKILIQNHKNLYQIKKQNGQIDSQKTKENEQQAIFTVTLAGLMHDIGIGPYTQAFNQLITDKWSRKSSQLKIFKHDQASWKIFENMKIQDIQKRLNKTTEVWQRLKKRVLALIKGKKQDSQQSSDLAFRPWEFQLIKNQLTGIDADKMDYICRDALHLGARDIYVDFDLLMNQSRILLGKKGYRIAYPSKYADKVMGIYFSRYKLYKQYYLNSINLGIRSMFYDIMQKVDDHPRFNFFKKTYRLIKKNDSVGYLGLTDDILERIEQIDLDEQIHLDLDKQIDLDEQKNLEMKEKMKEKIKQSKNLIKRIKSRDIYRFVKSSHNYFDHNIYEEHQKKEFNKKNREIERIFNKDYILKRIIQYSNNMLQPKDIFIRLGDITFGIISNPLNQIKLFNKGQNKIIEDISPSQFSLLSPKSFIEKYIAVFSTGDDQAKFNCIKQSFSRFIEQQQINQGVHKFLTPKGRKISEAFSESAKQLKNIPKITQYRQQVIVGDKESQLKIIFRPSLNAEFRQKMSQIQFFDSMFYELSMENKILLINQYLTQIPKIEIQQISKQNQKIIDQLHEEESRIISQENNQSSFEGQALFIHILKTALETKDGKQVVITRQSTVRSKLTINCLLTGLYNKFSIFQQEIPTNIIPSTIKFENISKNFKEFKKWFASYLIKKYQLKIQKQKLVILSIQNCSIKVQWTYLEQIQNGQLKQGFTLFKRMDLSPEDFCPYYSKSYQNKREKGYIKLRQSHPFPQYQPFLCKKYALNIQKLHKDKKWIQQWVTSFLRFNSQKIGQTITGIIKYDLLKQQFQNKDLGKSLNKKQKNIPHKSIQSNPHFQYQMKNSIQIAIRGNDVQKYTRSRNTHFQVQMPQGYQQQKIYRIVFECKIDPKSIYIRRNIEDSIDSWCIQHQFIRPLGILLINEQNVNKIQEETQGSQKFVYENFQQQISKYQMKIESLLRREQGYIEYICQDIKTPSFK